VSFFWFFLYLFSSLALFGFILRLIQAFLNDNHPLQIKLPIWGNNFIWMGVLGLGWFTLRQLSIGFFGARFWLLFGLIWFLTIIFLILKYYFIFYKLEIAYFKKHYLNKE
jgi:hypothetical protein